jgi:hypothetical protein
MNDPINRPVYQLFSGNNDTKRELLMRKYLTRSFAALATSLGLVACSCAGDPCEGIELLSTSHFFVNTTVRVQNTTDERKLVTFSMLNNGIEVATPELWVAARDITEAQIHNENRLDMKIKHCE